jgi:glucose/arabinose dehydrogenase
MSKNPLSIIKTVSFLLMTLFALQSIAIQSLPDGFSSSTLLLGKQSFTAYHPQNFKLEAINLNLIKPRIIHFHGNRMFVGSRSGEVYWMDPPYETTHSLGRLKGYPHSIVIKDEFIYIATTGAIIRAPYDQDSPQLSSEEPDLYIRLPDGKGHSSRTLKIGPDNKLYVSLGISGNCSDEYLENSYPPLKRRGGVFQIVEISGQPTLIPYASGLRNPVGFDWHPSTGQLYATNNGPDHHGFEDPPEYFSKLTQGSFHGMPWYQFIGGEIVKDTCVTSSPPKSAAEVSLPVAIFPARNAPMDMVFVPQYANAKEYLGDAIVALRGSWGTAGDGSANGDKSSRRPPKLVLVKFNDGKAVGVEDLVVGFQSPNSGSRWARPVGVAVAPDGDIYFTSDAANQGLYKLSRREKSTFDLIIEFFENKLFGS